MRTLSAEDHTREPKMIDEGQKGRILTVSLDESEHELLVALFYNVACPDQEVIRDEDWEPLVGLAAKLGLGDIRQF